MAEWDWKNCAADVADCWFSRAWSRSRNRSLGVVSSRAREFVDVC